MKKRYLAIALSIIFLVNPAIANADSATFNRPPDSNVSDIDDHRVITYKENVKHIPSGESQKNYGKRLWRKR